MSRFGHFPLPLFIVAEKHQITLRPFFSSFTGRTSLFMKIGFTGEPH